MVVVMINDVTNYTIYTDKVACVMCFCSGLMCVYVSSCLWLLEGMNAGPIAKRQSGPAWFVFLAFAAQEAALGLVDNFDFVLLCDGSVRLTA